MWFWHLVEINAWADMFCLGFIVYLLCKVHVLEKRLK